MQTTHINKSNYVTKFPSLNYQNTNDHFLFARDKSDPTQHIKTKHYKFDEQTTFAQNETYVANRALNSDVITV